MLKNKSSQKIGLKNRLRNMFNYRIKIKLNMVINGGTAHMTSMEHQLRLWKQEGPEDSASFLFQSGNP